jgi:hypothetical protein
VKASQTVRAPAASSDSSQYPIYSSYFTGNTPFHHTVNELKAAGATVLSAHLADNYWAQGLGNLFPVRQSGGAGPIYFAHNGDPAYKFSCRAYGKCDADGLVVHFPVGAAPQTGDDHHLTSFDPVFLKGEVDGFGGAGDANEVCDLKPGSPGTNPCSWGGFFPFSGDGLAHGYSSGQAGGYALGLMDITAQELLQGHIDHAIGIDQSCLDDGGVYPSIIGRTTDAKCPAYLEPNVKYGQMIHLKDSVDIDSLGYSPYCKVIVRAFQKYGAYTASNNGSWGIALDFEYMNNYASGSNPWYTTIIPSIDAGGDGTGTGNDFRFGSCLNRLTASDIEVIQISPKLPA